MIVFAKISVIAVFTVATAYSAMAETQPDKQNNVLLDQGSWPELMDEFVGDANVTTGGELFDLVAPYRAHNAGTVPIEINQTNWLQTIDTMQIVVDENPSPLVATIEFGNAMHPVKFETRVRVDQYSNVRAIATTPEGKKYMNGRFVKASGGCSAPATSDPELALQSMGKMKLKEFNSDELSSNRREIQLMIRHPNYSGLQRDQITHLFVDAHFINELQVFQGDEVLFSLEGGISISENPVFRFEYNDDGTENIRVRAVDINDNVFEKSFVGTQAVKI